MLFLPCLPQRSGFGLNELLGGRFKLPAREYQNCWMAVQGGAKHFGSLHSKVDAAILYAGNGGLRNAAQGGKLSLAETLQFTDDPHRFTGGYINSLLGWDEIAHVSVSDSHVV